MKFLFCFLAIILVFGNLMAQAPNSFKYQAIIRGNTGVAVANRAIRLQVVIRQGNAGPIVYQEMHSVTTNAQGMSLLNIGRGSRINNSPTFSTLNWSGNPFFMEVSLDSTGNGPFVNMSAFELLSVPYALYSGNGLPSNGQEGDLLYWNGTSWVTVGGGGGNQVLTFCNGAPQWTQGGQCANVTSISCISATQTGVLISRVVSSGVSVSIPYIGGNGAAYPAQTIASTGVTGLVATLTSGNLQVGNGSLSYTITGTPNSSGTAVFSIQMGAQSCSLQLPVVPLAGSISSILCSTSRHSGLLVSGVPAGTVNTAIYYTGGNGGLYSSQTIASSGVTGLMASLSAGTLMVGSGEINLVITGTPASSGTATFNLTIGGQACSFTRTVENGTITSLACGSAINNGALFRAVPASGVSSTISYTGGNGGLFSGEVVASTGVLGLTASLNPGTLAVGNGSVSYSISGTPQSSGVAVFTISVGGQVCQILRSVGSAYVASLDCNYATLNGMLVNGMAASQVSVQIAYTGGNGMPYNVQTISSTGVTGLTASLVAGSVQNGNGSISYSITGIPSASGNAIFSINFGGQTCNLSLIVSAIGSWRQGYVHCRFPFTQVVEVTNPTTGRIWMDRNLGAGRVATSSTDTMAYGDYFQWGRPADGHQCRSSASTTTTSSSSTPGHGDFIVNGSYPKDWRVPQFNPDLFLNPFAVGNPCPIGFRPPTAIELEDERLTWATSNAAGAFNGPLKFPRPGYRYFDLGSFTGVGTFGVYWSCTPSRQSGWPEASENLRIAAASAGISATEYRATGMSIRCIRH